MKLEHPENLLPPIDAMLGTSGGERQACAAFIAWLGRESDRVLDIFFDSGHAVDLVDYTGGLDA